MRLSDEQKQAVADWLREKLEHRRCLLCESNRLTIGDNLLVVQPQEPVIDPASPEGLVQVICENCGHVQAFDVRRIAAWQFPVQDASQMPLM